MASGTIPWFIATENQRLQSRQAEGMAQEFWKTALSNSPDDVLLILSMHLRVLMSQAFAVMLNSN